MSRWQTRAVFFDLYNTLVRFWPPREEIQLQVLKEMGLEAERDGLTYGYWQADRFWSQENGRRPLEQRSPEERDRFFAEYESIILRAAGLDLSPEQALQLFQRVRSYPRRWEPYEDVLPTLDALRRRGLTIGVLTNVPSQERADSLLSDALRDRIDFMVTSTEAGAPKPHPQIFQLALRRANARPEEALHVGDQYDADVAGARAVGIPVLLLDREDAHRHVTDVVRIRSLREVLQYLDRRATG